MPFEAFRFMHAAGTLVDHQLRDVAGLDDGLKPRLLDATLTSFRRIVDRCLEHGVDFLLLTGDTFDESDRSLRSRVAIRNGFHLLDEAGVQVFVVPGSRDPAEAWQAVSGLPDNVTIFHAATDEPAAIMRDGNVIATLQACRPLNRTNSDAGDSGSAIGQSRIAPFRIGILPPSESTQVADEATVEEWLTDYRVDYLALPSPSRRLRVLRPDQIGYCPGPATAMTRRDTGPHGCTLFNVESRGTFEDRLFVTSPVRREHIQIRLDDESSWDQLIADMRGQVEALPAIEAAAVLLLTWKIHGQGELFESLAEEDARNELLEFLSVDISLPSETQASHSIEIVTDRETTASGLRKLGADSAAEDSPAASFQRRIDAPQSIVRSVMQRLSERGDVVSSPWMQRMEVLARRVDHSAVTESVRQHGAQWFSADNVTAEADGEEFGTEDFDEV